MSAVSQEKESNIHCCGLNHQELLLVTKTRELFQRYQKQNYEPELTWGKRFCVKRSTTEVIINKYKNSITDDLPWTGAPYAKSHVKATNNLEKSEGSAHKGKD